MMSMNKAFHTPWKIWNEFHRWIVYPQVRLLFAMNGIPWGSNWRIYGAPIIQKHRQSRMKFGSGLGLRSTPGSNPLGVNHPVILCTWEAGAVLEIGDNFGMTGGSICAAEKISIGNNVAIGANTTIIDTDFHPLDPDLRRLHPQQAKTAPITIEDDVFIGMQSMILKGVTIGRGAVVGAGSVITRDIPAYTVVAGNPAKILRAVR